MKKGIVNVNMITSKRGGYIHKGKEVSENDVNGFDELVGKGSIITKDSEAAEIAAKKEADEAQLKAEKEQKEADEAKKAAEIAAKKVKK